MKSKGFTLIELLVVITIIGILASVVLASLNSARAKSADAAIKTTLGDFRVQAQNYYNSNNNYGTPGADILDNTLAACSTANTVFDPVAPLSINPAIVGAEKISDSSATWVATCVMPTSGESWAVSIPLKTNPSQYWCVDSSNTGKIAPAVMAFGVAKCQ